MKLPCNRSVLTAAVICSIAIILLITIVFLRQKSTNTIDNDLHANDISSEQSSMNNLKKSGLSTDNLSSNEKPNSFFTWKIDSKLGNSATLETTLQPIDGSAAKEILFSLPFVPGEFSERGGNDPIQYNSSSNSIVIRKYNYNEYEQQNIDPRFSFCDALFQVKEGQTDPTLILEATDNCHRSPLKSWIVHPRLPLLFVVTKHEELNGILLTVIDLTNPTRRKDFGPVSHNAEVQELRVSSDGNTVYSFQTDGVQGRDGLSAGMLWSFDILTSKINSLRFSHPFEGQDDFPISLTLNPESFSPTLDWVAYHFGLIRLSDDTLHDMVGTEKYDGWNSFIQWSSDGKWLVAVQSDDMPRNNDRTKKYVFAYNPTTKELKQIPLDPTYMTFIPGTHILTSSKGENYDLDSGKSNKFPMFSRKIQWIWSASNQKTPLQLPVSDPALSTSSTASANSLAMTALNINEAKIECAPSKIPYDKNWSETLGFTACIPAELATGRLSTNTEEGIYGKRTFLSFAPKEDGQNRSSTENFFIHSTNDFNPQPREFGANNSSPKLRMYKVRNDCNTLLTTKDGTKGSICYEWTRQPSPAALYLKKIVFFPFKSYYIVAEHNSYLGPEGDIRTLQAALENGEYSLPTMRHLKLFDFAVKSMDFSKYPDYGL